MIMKSTTYYVSSLNGSDSNSGTAQTEAFKTLDAINKIKLKKLRSTPLYSSPNQERAPDFNIQGFA